MATFVRPFRAAIALALAVASTGCESVLGPGRTIVLPITVLETPAAIAPGETLVVRATVQSGGCLRFLRLEAVRAAGRVTLTALGLDNSSPETLCPADIRTEVHEHRVEPPLGDPFTVAARQPDGTETTRVVRVQ